MSHILGRPLTIDEKEFEAKVRSWKQVWTVTPAGAATARDRFWMRYSSGNEASEVLVARVKEAHEKFERDSNNDALHFRDLGWSIKRID